MKTTKLSAIERAALAAIYLTGTDATVNGRRPSCATYRALSRKGLRGPGGLTDAGRAIGKAAADEEQYAATRPDGTRVEWYDASMTFRRGAVTGRSGSTLTVNCDGTTYTVPAGHTLIAA